MTSRRKLILIILATASVAAVGILFVEAGNIAIRRIQSGSSQSIQLELSEPVVLGVPTPVKWSLPANTANRAVDVRLRTAAGEESVALAQLSDQQTIIVFPCTLETRAASVSLVDAQSRSLIAWKNIKTLPPGQDCF